MHPGGSQDLGETPEECGVREVLEETRFEIKINRLLGVFSSLKYESVNYPWKGREYLHCFFMGEIIGSFTRIKLKTFLLQSTLKNKPDLRRWGRSAFSLTLHESDMETGPIIVVFFGKL